MVPSYPPRISLTLDRMSLNLDRILDHPTSPPSAEKGKSHHASPLKQRLSRIFRRSLTLLSTTHEAEEDDDDDDDDSFDFACKGEAEQVVTIGSRYEDYTSRKDCKVWG